MREYASAENVSKLLSEAARGYSAWEARCYAVVRNGGTPYFGLFLAGEVAAVPATPIQGILHRHGYSASVDDVRQTVQALVDLLQVGP